MIGPMRAACSLISKSRAPGRLLHLVQQAEPAVEMLERLYMRRAAGRAHARGEPALDCGRDRSGGGQVMRHYLGERRPRS